MIAILKVSRVLTTPSVSSSLKSTYFFKSSTLSSLFFTCHVQSFHSSSVTLGKNFFLVLTMIVGNGYTVDHADITLQELRESAALREIFNELYL